MKKFSGILTACLIGLTSISTVQAGVESVGNGGGASEQAVMVAGLRLQTYYKHCSAIGACYQNETLHSALKGLMVCKTPDVQQFRFEVPKKTSKLQSHTPYLFLNNELIINRELLYTQNTPLNVSEALGYVSRIYADYCNILPFSESADFFKPLVVFANAAGEQISVGKDSIFLPKKEWIRIKTFYSDLLIESQQEVVRIQCPQKDLDTCTLLSEDETSDSELSFSNLGVVDETLENGIVSFHIEGHVGNAQIGKLPFSLKAEYKEGALQKIYFMEKELLKAKRKNAI